jgi:hypothetical protein
MIELPAGGGLLKVEATGYGGEQKLTFDQAVQAGAKKFADLQKTGRFLVVDVGRELSSGRVSNPELPAVPADFLERAGIRRRR